MTRPGEKIQLKGVTTNNLKNISVDFPLYKLNVVTGVSGSGKSSLVFDTLYAESYRRYVESLSSFARQYLKALPKPRIEAVKNLPPAIAVKQSKSGLTNRSTVGTLTEVVDTLRIVFSHFAEIRCHKCRQQVKEFSSEEVVQSCYKDLSSQKIMVLSDLSLWKEIGVKETRKILKSQGFSRVLEEANILKLDDWNESNWANVWLVVDRLEVVSSNKSRLLDACQVAFKIGRGTMALADGTKLLSKFSVSLECCGTKYLKPTLGLFNFNHPLGACQKCQGFGKMSVVDALKVIPDLKQSLITKGVACWNFGEHVSVYELALKSISLLKMSSKLKEKNFEEYSPEELEWLWKGDGKKYFGIEGYFKWLDTKRYKPHYRIHSARFRKYITCEDCGGDRLNQLSLACYVEDQNIAQVSNMNVDDLLIWLEQIVKGMNSRRNAAEEAVFEAKSRLVYLKKMGLNYLSQSRSASTLSGGEVQRINMSRCLGSILTDTLFCLDEPTSGLHPRDSGNLLDVIYELRDLGNTIVVVEHEKTLIDGADFFIEIGPKAGHLGGEVIYSGEGSQWPIQKKSVEFVQFDKSNRFIELRDANVHNLKNVTVKFPIGKITSVCGVSGSGKTSLVKHCLFPALKSRLSSYYKLNDDGEIGIGGELKRWESVGPEKLINEFEDVLLVSQVSLGRSSRSTIGTYLGLMDEVRKILAGTEESKRFGLTPGSFSFNVAGGRCESCRGLGTVVEDLSFLGEMEIVCPTCNGERFQEKILNVRYRDKNLIEMLSMTVLEARSFFHERQQIVNILDAVIEIGMGYITLGQHTSSFSGGEAQRLKLVQIIKESKNSKPLILIFDEPTTGLSDSDVSVLFKQFRRMTSHGHTLIVIEHHLDVLKMSDWLIEIGPESAQRGGEVIYEGVPSGLSGCARSVTSKYLF